MIGFSLSLQNSFESRVRTLILVNADVLVTEVPLMDWQIRELGRVTYRNDVLTVIDLRNPAP